ncbi:MBL fold metallo-hydrolase [Synechococcus sp. CCY 9618]|uniref:MBL fold metallo-hydrolase n=1 Tax=Synechococcus sp. CCY 9618 TaxID=2815602 RepID=UPI0020B366F3|nr:MBL fold metallo-hydrolase [Synechococcus sp. CCY 9618]
MASSDAALLPSEEGRPPQPVRPGLWLFAPSRESQGGSAWLLVTAEADLLIDCPAYTGANLRFLAARAWRGGGLAGSPPAWIVLTGRGGHGRCRRLQQALGWPVLVQEQEAYLLPGVEPLHSFAAEHRLGQGLRLLWTPGPSPGACVVHVGPAAAAAGQDGLFCGRLLVPVAPARLAPLRLRGTFHWGRQLRSLEHLRRWLPAGSPGWIASGAGLGALRGPKLVEQGALQLAGLDLEALALQPPGGSSGVAWATGVAPAGGAMAPKPLS